MNQGFLYVATGTKYLKEAESSARSLKSKVTGANITLVTDKPYSSSLFDNIILQGFESINEESWKANLIYKVIGISSSPYEKTVFLDTDTYVCEDFSELFDLLNFQDILICHGYYDKSLINFEGKEIKSYTPYNTGVIGFRKSEALTNFLKKWRSTYEEEIETFWSDQPAFMKALLYFNLKVFTLHSIYNFRFPQNLAIPDGESVKILHGRKSLQGFQILQERLNKTTVQRVWVASQERCYSWSDNGSLGRVVKSFIRNLFVKVNISALK